jgi:hypothetical protein
VYDAVRHQPPGAEFEVVWGPGRSQSAIWDALPQPNGVKAALIMTESTPASGSVYTCLLMCFLLGPMPFEKNSNKKECRELLRRKEQASIIHGSEI